MSAIRSIRLSALLASLAACVSHTPISDTPRASANGEKGDAANGKAVFLSSCSTCHGVTKDVDSTKMVGPSLFGVVGRKAGTVRSLLGPSEKLKNYGVTWTTETLDVFLTNPLAILAPDTAMAGILKDPQQRTDVIAYLATLKN
jgi:cytochrome c